MSRPQWMSRGAWFAQRRNRRGRPVTLADIRIVEDHSLITAFRKIPHAKSYGPPLFVRREAKP